MATDPQIALDKAKAALTALIEWLDENRNEIGAHIPPNVRSRCVFIDEAVELPAPHWKERGKKAKELAKVYDQFSDIQKAEVFCAQVGLLFGQGASFAHDSFTAKQAEFILDWYKKQFIDTNKEFELFSYIRDREIDAAMSLYEARMGRDDEGADK